MGVEPGGPAEFYKQVRASGLVRRLLELARDEDLGSPQRDLTSELMCAPASTLRCAVVARERAILCGLALAEDLFEVFGCAHEVDWQCACSDGDPVEAGRHVATIGGPARSVLALERTLLNLLGRLSGVASLTHSYRQAIGAHDRAQLCDTRKTTPGLRVLEKYAVVCGGGTSHRMGLHDAVLIKDNHLAGVATDAIAAYLTDVARRARQESRCTFVEVEVDCLEQFEQVLRVERGLIDMVLLDNFPVHELASAVQMRDGRGSGVLLEASGGVRLETIGAIASTGVDRISVGALTHSAVSVDFGLDAL